MHYGLNGNAPMTLNEIGYRIKYSRSNVGVIIQRALAKLTIDNSPGYKIFREIAPNVTQHTCRTCGDWMECSNPKCAKPLMVDCPKHKENEPT